MARREQNLDKRARNGGNNEKQFMRFVFIFCFFFYGKYVEVIGLKAPGNDSVSFWSDKILVLLCEGPKPNMSMISGFLNPKEPLFNRFRYTQIRHVI